jgi:competence protein ComEA
MAFDPFTNLAPSARAPARNLLGRAGVPGRSRVRIGLGAAIVLLLVALAITVAVTAIGQVGHSIEIPANPSAGPTADGQAAAPVDPSSSPPPAPTAPPAVPAPGVFVHVLGAVANPGVFEVQEGARVLDVVAAAGGLLPAADEAGLNLARFVVDGEQLYVPAQGEVAPGPPATGATGKAGAAGGSAVLPGQGQGSTKVNLNTATVADLDTLPRIGPAMAQRILDYRVAEGRFASVDDLRNVTGIGEKTFAALKDLVTV